ACSWLASEAGVEGGVRPFGQQLRSAELANRGHHQYIRRRGRPVSGLSSNRQSTKAASCRCRSARYTLGPLWWVTSARCPPRLAATPRVDDLRVSPPHVR